MTGFVRASLIGLVFASLAGCRSEPPDALSGAPEAGVQDDAAVRAPVAHPTASGAPTGTAPLDHDHAHEEGGGAAPAAPPAQGPPVIADEPTTVGEARGIQWAVPQRWPLVGEEDEFRVRTWRLPALSMAGAGECVLYRFPGGGEPQDNLKRWMGQFRGPDGTVESVEAEQAQRLIQGRTAWLVRAQGTYVSQGQTMEGPEEEFPDFGLFGAVVIADGDPAFVKCTGPMAVMAQEANAILAVIDSLLVSAN